MGSAHHSLAVSSDSIITPLNTVALVSLCRFPTPMSRHHLFWQFALSGSGLGWMELKAAG
jgi:hypothetical protein